MKLQAIVQDSETGRTFDISDTISEATWETFLTDQPGKLSFSYTDDVDTMFSEGSPLSFKVNNNNVFFGYVFKRNKTKDEMASVLAYDQMRYLKNKNFYYLEGLTASQSFTRICSDFKLKSSIITPSTYVIPPYIHDNKSLFEIIQYGIDQTLINTGNWYMIRDNFGTVQFVSLNSLKTPLFIGDESMLLDFKFESSIDTDTYNQIKLVKENKDTAKREVYIVKDSVNIKKWGTLQYFEVVDENANAAQIKARGDQLIKLKNRKTKSLSLDCTGDLRAFAGAGIVLGLSALQKEGIGVNQYFMTRSAKHVFKNDLHMMHLEMQVSI